MTPAVKLLDKHKINYKLNHYDHDPNVNNFGLEAAEKTGHSPNQIFKTLLVSINGDDKELAVMVLPVSGKLNLKLVASALKVKKLDLADKDIAQKITGYLLGGISPLGQKKLLPTFIDESAKNFATIFISGGKRGLSIELDPISLSNLTRATFVNIQK